MKPELCIQKEHFVSLSLALLSYGVLYIDMLQTIVIFWFSFTCFLPFIPDEIQWIVKVTPVVLLFHPHNQISAHQIVQNPLYIQRLAILTKHFTKLCFSWKGTYLWKPIYYLLKLRWDLTARDRNFSIITILWCQRSWHRCFLNAGVSTKISEKYLWQEGKFTLWSYSR